ncbi:MAG: adenosine kinase, partial [Prolixibacteraceae bacterium]|nr:adenosine kinase [Prolixibacteraceae bacterium]
MDTPKDSSSVLCIGNALVDIMIALESDAILQQYNLLKGSMTLINSDLSRKIYESTFQFRKEMKTGGSAANTAYTLACLGAKSGYVGKVGDDDLGRFFSRDFQDKNINAHLFSGQSDTGRVMALVGADSERTMATYLGAAAELQPGDFTPQLAQLYDFVYIEGYLVQDHLLIESIAKIAHENKRTVVFDAASFNIVEQNLEFMKKLIAQYIDIVFANEEEALALTGLEPEEAVVEIAGMCRLAIVKTGKSGSLICDGNETIKIEPVPTEAVDSTGAGDNYAAGFLYGYTRN